MPVQGLPPNVSRTYTTLAELGDVPLTTLYHRAYGRRSKEQKARSQQYLILSKEKAQVSEAELGSGLENRHPELKSRRVRAVDWNRHEDNIYYKATHWSEVIGKILQDLAFLLEDVNNMDETGLISESFIDSYGSILIVSSKQQPTI